MITSQQIGDYRKKRNSGKQVSTESVAEMRKQYQERVKSNRERKSEIQSYDNDIHGTTSIPVKAPEVGFTTMGTDWVIRNQQLKDYINSPQGYTRYIKEPDFEEYSKKGSSIENKNGKKVLGVFRGEPHINNKVEWAFQNKDALYMSAMNGGHIDKKKDGDPILTQMTQDERNIYNYLLGKEGNKKADEYLDLLYDDLEKRNSDMWYKGVKDLSSENKVAGLALNLGSTLFAPAAVIEMGKQKVNNVLSGENKPLDLYGNGMEAIRLEQATHEGLTGDMKGMGKFLADTGISTAQFITQLPFGETAALGIMASNSAGSTAYDVTQRGGTMDQALISGATAGIAEAFIEKIGIDRLFEFKNMPITGVKQLGTELLRGMGSEGVEEGATEIVNMVTDQLVMGDKSQYQLMKKDLLSQGYSEKEANKLVAEAMAKQIGLSVAGGALSGAVFSGGAFGLNASSTSSLGKDIKANDGTSELIDQGMNMQPSSDAYRIANTLSGKQQSNNMSNYQLGSLAMAVYNGQNVNAEENATISEPENTVLKPDTNSEPIQTNNTELPVDMAGQTIRKPEKATDIDISWDGIEGAKLKGVASVKEGKMNVAIESDGKSVVDSLENVKFNSPELLQVYTQAENYKTNGAKAFVSNYDSNIDLPTYKKAFDVFYDGGVTNIPMEKIESAYSSFIPLETKITAYNAGINDTQMKKAVKLSSEFTGIIESETSKKLSQNVYEGLNALGKVSGVKIQIDETIAGGQANGMYKDGVIHIALDSNNPYMTVAKHELTHSIQESSPELYKKYRDYVINEISKRDSSSYNDMIDRLVSRYNDIGETITRDEAMDEIVADASEMFLTDPDSIERLAAEDKGIAEKILDAIRDLVDKIRTALSQLEPKSKAAIALNQNMEVAQNAEKLWIEALKNESEFNETQEVAATKENVSEESNAEESNKIPEGAKLQLKDVDKTEYYKALHENKKLKEINTMLKEQFSLTKELKPDKSQLVKAAKEILNKAKSSYSVDSLVENLESVWKFVHEYSDQMYTDEAVEAIQSMSIMILRKSQEIDNTLVENGKEMLEEIKKTPIILAAKDRADLASEGGFSTFRRKYIGKIRIVAENGIMVDEFFKELSQKYPEYFNEEEVSHPADQLIKIADTIDFIKPIYHNPYGMNIDEAARDLTYDIISTAYFDIKQAPATFADKKKLELEKIKIKYRQKVNEIHMEYKNKFSERLAEVKKNNESKVSELLEKYENAKGEEKKIYQERIQKLRDQNIQKLKAQQQRFSERMQMSRARRERSMEAGKYKTRIKSIAKDLSDMLLKPTEKKHLPKGFRDAVKGICQILDFETGTLGPNGEPTQAALRWRKLKDAYSELKDDENTNVNSMYFENMETDIKELTAIVENRRVNQLNHEDLKRVYDVMKHIKYIINKENTFFKENIKETVSSAGDSVISRLGSSKKYTQAKLFANNGILEAATEMLTNKNIKPYYFFKKIGGEIERLYKNIRDGEDKFVENFENGNAYAHELEKKYDYFSWTNKKNESEEFTTVHGDKISLTIGEKLYIYAAYRRKQGKGHILKGGVITNEPKVVTEKKDGKTILKDVVYQSDPVQFTEKDMENLAESLTHEQKSFVAEMVEYLSKDLAKLGNEVTNQLFGMDAYMDENYIPLTSDRSYLNTIAGVTDDKRVERMAFTKPTVKNASNPIIATDFMKIWSKHLVDMSMYNSLVLPLKDFQRVWNYKTKSLSGEEASVKNAIKKAYGPKANKYIETLLSDINGGIKQVAGGKLSNILLSKMKIDAVMGNLSVAIQQPSSIARAFAVINPKYFIKTTFSKRDYDELIKYSPQARLKQYGYFDVNMGQSLTDVVTQKEYEGPIEKFKAFFTDKNVRDEVFSWLPQKMDEITWCHIWNAVKSEAKDKTNLTEGSEAFYEHVKERFKEVIDRTQVMDSVFQRSEMMRSQNPLDKIATNFMGEPTVTYNMIYDAISEYKKKGKSATPYVVKSVMAVVSAMVLNSLLKSIITASRNKDDDKEFVEKYLDSFISNLKDDPLSMIPYVNTISSITQGYSSVRPDMQIIQNLYYAWNKLDSDKYTPAEKTLQLASAIAPIFDIPLKNISRDIESLWRNGSEMFEKVGIMEGLSDYEKLKVKYPTIDSSVASGQYYDMIYAAKKNNDTELYNNLYQDLIKNGKKPSTIENAIRDRVKDELKTNNEAVDKLKDKSELDGHSLVAYVIIMDDLGEAKKKEKYMDMLTDTNKIVLDAVYAYDKKDIYRYTQLKKQLMDSGYELKDITSAVESISRERLKANAPSAEEFIEAYQTGNYATWQPLFQKMRAAGWSQKDILALVK